MLKRILFILLVGLLHTNLFSQNDTIVINDGPISCPSDVADSTDDRSYSYFINQVRSISEARENRGEEVSDKYIPVIVNVIHEGEYIGVGSNISDQMVEEAIEHLNESFRLATEVYGSPSTQSETHFYFFLATQDAQGNSIEPIRRFNKYQYSALPNSGDGYTYMNNAGTIVNLVGYETDKFLNIQIARWSASGGEVINGFAHFPWSSNRNNGIFMRDLSIYNNNTKTFIFFGNTYYLDGAFDHVLAHEAGHYLGLWHVFRGVGAGCPSQSYDYFNNNCETIGDEICDTPPKIQYGSVCGPTTIGPFTYTPGTNPGCSDPQFNETYAGEFIHNYMDYADACDYFFFSDGQIDRMHSATYLGRQTLLENGAAIFASSSGTPGCIDPIACNYDEAATFDNGSCTYPDYGYDCNGDCLSDADEDGVCDLLEVDGCDDPSACNYDVSATEDDGSCIYATGCDTCSGETDGTGVVVDGDSDDDGFCDDEDNTQLTLQFVNTLDNDTMDVYRVYAVLPTTDSEVNAVYSIGTSESGTVNLTTTVSTSFYQNPVGAAMADDINPFYYTAFPTLLYDSWLTIGSEDSDDPSISKINIQADLANFEDGNDFSFSGTSGGSWYITPGSNPLAVAGDDYKVLLAQFAVYKDGLNKGIVSLEWNIDWKDSNGVTQSSLLVSAFSSSSVVELSGCLDPTACNYNENATTSDGSCTYPAEDYLDCNGDCLNDADGDGVCDELEIPGCTDSTACNYNENATDDNDSCEYPQTYYDCNGDCLNDTDGDGVCDELEIPGCTDQTACNYNAEATNDDDTCTYATPGYDCDGVCIDANENGVCDIEEFECGVETVTFDSFEYSTVLIGTQCWFVENLRTTTYANGTQIPEVTENSEWKGLTTGARSSYNNEADSSLVYGHLYNWYAVTGDSICPTDWGVPTDEDWKELEEEMGMPVDLLNSTGYRGEDQSIALGLKADSLWSSLPGNNSSGFNALPAGIRLDFSGSFEYVQDRAYWWTLNNYRTIKLNNRNNAWFRVMHSEDQSIQRQWNFQQTSDGQGHGMSVRCIKK